MPGAGGERLKNFKNFGKDSDELRRRRNDNLVELRKARKDEEMSKRRNIDTDELEVSKIGENSNWTFDVGDDVPPECIKKIVDDMSSDDMTRQHGGTQSARKILSRERHPPIDVMIEAGVVPLCIEFLKKDFCPDLQFEASSVLINIASGNSAQTEIVVRAGAIEQFINLLRSPYNYVVEQAVWALGNITGDGPNNRDLVISKGIIPPLIALINSQADFPLIRNIAWAIHNLCRAKDQPPPVQAIREILPALGFLICHDDLDWDLEIATHACWALSYLSDGSNEKIQEVVKSGVVSRIVELLECQNYNVITPCLRTVGNIVTGSDAQTQAVVKAGALKHLAKLLQCPKPNIVKEAAWTISNIAAGTAEQIQEIINADIIPLLIDVINNGEFRGQKEACWAITNITSSGNAHFMVYLCEKGIVPAFCGMLLCKDWRTVLVIMDGLENILKAAVKLNQGEKITLTIEECGGLDKIEHLQSHENQTIYTKAYHLIDTYFSDDEGKENNAVLLPTTDNNGELHLNHGSNNFQL